MTIILNFLIQLLAFGVQTAIVVGLYNYSLIGKLIACILVGTSFTQSITSLIAHFKNPDGTPAEVSYIKEDE